MSPMWRLQFFVPLLQRFVCPLLFSARKAIQYPTQRILIFAEFPISLWNIINNYLEKLRIQNERGRMVIASRKQLRSSRKKTTWMTKTPDKTALVVQLHSRDASYPTSWIVVKTLASEPAKVRKFVVSESCPVCLLIIFEYIWGHLDRISIGRLVRGRIYYFERKEKR